MIGDVRGVLTCPVCGRGFDEGGPAAAAPGPSAAPPSAADPAPAVLRCPAGHSFDIARQGYVNLLPGGARPGTADTAGMVAARAAFLSAGHYAPLAGVVAGLAAASAAAPAPPAPGAGVSPGPSPAPGAAPCVLDAGAGTGYYLAAVLDRLRARPGYAGTSGLALDISARALRHAARARPGIGAVVWDIWQPLPVRDGAAALVLNVFAPRNAPEFRRVLRDGGALIVVTPGPGHLAELAGPAGLLAVDERKEERLAAALGAFFTPPEERGLTIALRLTRPQAASLAGMGPAARHAGAAGLRERLAGLAEPIKITATFRISRYRPR